MRDLWHQIKFDSGKRGVSCFRKVRGRVLQTVQGPSRSSWSHFGTVNTISAVERVWRLFIMHISYSPFRVSRLPPLSSVCSPGPENYISQNPLPFQFLLGLADRKHQQEMIGQEEKLGGVSSPLPPFFCPAWAIEDHSCRQTAPLSRLLLPLTFVPRRSKSSYVAIPQMSHPSFFLPLPTLLQGAPWNLKRTIWGLNSISFWDPNCYDLFLLYTVVFKWGRRRKVLTKNIFILSFVFISAVIFSSALYFFTCIGIHVICPFIESEDSFSISSRSYRSACG